MQGPSKDAAHPHSPTRKAVTLLSQVIAFQTTLIRVLLFCFLRSVMGIHYWLLLRWHLQRNNSMNTRIKTLFIILWPFLLMFRIIKWLFQSCFGEISRANLIRSVPSLRRVQAERRACDCNSRCYNAVN